jgi:hypothetical protein
MEGDSKFAIKLAERLHAQGQIGRQDTAAVMFGPRHPTPIIVDFTVVDAGTPIISQREHPVANVPADD